MNSAAKDLSYFFSCQVEGIPPSAVLLGNPSAEQDTKKSKFFFFLTNTKTCGVLWGWSVLRLGTRKKENRWCIWKAGCF